MNKNLGAAAAVSGLRDDIVDKEVEQVLMKGQPKRLASAKPNNYALPEDDDDEDPAIAVDEDEDDYSDVDGAGVGDADPMEDEMEGVEDDDGMEDIEAEQIVNITNKEN